MPKGTKKVIALVIHSLQPGGMERVMSELAKHFSQKEELEVHLIMYGLKREIFFEIPPSVTLHQPGFEFDNSKRALSTWKTLHFLRNTIKRLKPDSILSMGEYWNSFVLLALFGLNYPVFISDRCQPDKSLGKVHDRLRKWLYPRATGVIAQTEKAKAIYHSQFRHNNIAVIGNPIRPIPVPGSTKKEPIILTVGRLIRSKHHDMLIRIFSRLEEPDWKLYIVGGDALKQDGMARLTKLIEELGLEDRVVLTGSVSNVEDYYHRSSIFAFTSSSEGFPNVIGEAMAAELPVVAFDCIAGPSDMIRDGENGFLVPLFDEETFEKRLRELIRDAFLRERFGRAAKKSIHASYALQEIGDRYYSFLNTGRARTTN